MPNLKKNMKANTIELWEECFDSHKSYAINMYQVLHRTRKLIKGEEIKHKRINKDGELITHIIVQEFPIINDHIREENEKTVMIYDLDNDRLTIYPNQDMKALNKCLEEIRRYNGYSFEVLNFPTKEMWGSQLQYTRRIDHLFLHVKQEFNSELSDYFLTYLESDLGSIEVVEQKNKQGVYKVVPITSKLTIDFNKIRKNKEFDIEIEDGWNDKNELENLDSFSISGSFVEIQEMNKKYGLILFKIEDDDATRAYLSEFLEQNKNLTITFTRTQ